MPKRRTKEDLCRGLSEFSLGTAASSPQAETTNGFTLSADGSMDPSALSAEGGPVTPEDIGARIASLLVDEIATGGAVDGSHQALALTLAVLGPERVSKVRLGRLSAATVQFLRELKQFTGLVFHLVRWLSRLCLRVYSLPLYRLSAPVRAMRVLVLFEQLRSLPLHAEFDWRCIVIGWRCKAEPLCLSLSADCRAGAGCADGDSGGNLRWAGGEERGEESDMSDMCPWWWCIDLLVGGASSLLLLPTAPTTHQPACVAPAPPHPAGAAAASFFCTARCCMLLLLTLARRRRRRRRQQGIFCRRQQQKNNRIQASRQARRQLVAGCYAFC